MDANPPPPESPLSPPLSPPVPVRLTTLPSRPCPYLPGRQSTTRAFLAERMPGSVYDRFMDAGFRRSGTMIYQPACASCRACVPLRVVTDTFRPTRSQRRAAARNADLTVAVDLPIATEEKFDLYRRYQADRHADALAEDADDDDDASGLVAFESFLYDSPVDTLEFAYRDPAGRLLAVGIADVSPESLSSVYFYYDPADRARGLGTFGAVHEIGWCRANGIRFYHLGYWVGGCRKLEYKRGFGPHQLLSPAGRWADVSDSPEV